MWVRKVVDKYRNMSQPAKAGLWFAICGFVQKGINFVTVPIFTRLLTTEQYGIVSVFNSWEALVSVLCTLNLFYGGFNNGMLDYKSRRDEYVSSVQGLITAITAGWVIVYLLGHHFFDGMLGMPPLLVWAMLLQILASAALLLWSARQRYEFQYRKLVLITLLNAVLGSGVSIAAILLSQSKYGAHAKILANAAVIVVLCGGIYFYNLQQGKRFYSKDIWKSAFCFNLPLLPHYLSTMVLNQADRIMIDRMVGSSEAGIYSVAYSASMVLNILASAINHAFAPWLYRRLDKKEYKGIAEIANIMFAGFAFVLIMLIAFAPECIYLLAGEKYIEAIVIVPPVASSLYFIFVYQIFANVEFFYKKNKFIAYASMLGAVLNIVLNYGGIRLFGYVAAGYTTLICYMLFCLAHFYFMSMICKKEFSGITLFHAKITFLIAAGLIAAAFLMLPLYAYPIIRYAILTVAFVVLIFNRNRIIKIAKTMKER